MKTFCGFSYFLALFIIFNSLGIRTFALAEEKCRERSRCNGFFNDPFALGLIPEDFFTPFFHTWTSLDYFKPWRRFPMFTKGMGSTIKTDKDQFQVHLELEHFSPDEISVKTADGYVTVEAKHEEKNDEHGYEARQFVKRFALPEGTEPDDVMSQLSSDGVLTIFAPQKVIPNKGERTVPISRTGRVRKET